MSNTANIILTLQEKLKTSDNALDLATYAKMIEKLQMNIVSVVSTFDDLPVVTDDGNIYLIESESELYYNVGSTWFSLGKITGDFIFSVGTNTSGNLGDNTILNKSSPVLLAGGITNWSFVSSGSRATFAISDGVLYSWGCTNSGNLGDGANVNRSSPVVVAGGLTNWSQASAGGRHSLGIAGGVAYAWGYNIKGQLGDNTAVNKSSPVTVVGGITNWTQVSAGGYHSLGIAGGIAYAWGGGSFFGIFGQLGDNTTTSRSSPVTVVGGITNWSQVSAGRDYSLGLTDTGIAYAWGNNITGKLGDDATINRSSPVTVVGGITNWSQMSAGSYHSLGLTNTGVAYAWGLNSSGQLGDETTIVRSSPVTVVGGITNWSQVSAGFSHNLGLTTSGIVYSWGYNGGQLGDGSIISRSSPGTVVGGITTWAQVSAGGSYSMLLGNDVIKRYTQ